MNKIRFLKDHFFTGLWVIIPLGVIGWILFSVFQAVWKFHELLPEAWLPSELSSPTGIVFLKVLMALSFGVGVLISISLLGWASKQYLGKKILDLVGVLIQRIPVVRSIYSALDQLFKTL